MLTAKRSLTRNLFQHNYPIISSSCGCLRWHDEKDPFYSAASVRRQYHATPRSEILPVIVGVAVLGLVGRYSYRAMQRMDAEWDEYRHALKAYEKQLLKEAANANLTKVVAIDLGTCFTKFAVSHPTIELVVSPQGDRSTFNGIVYNDDDDNKVIARGRSALERFYFHDTSLSVTMPFPILAAEVAGGTVPRSGKVIVKDVLSDALTEILDRLNLVPTATTTNQTKNIRKVVTIPTSFLKHVDLFGTAFTGIGNHGNIQTTTSYVPEPVAAVWGAQFQNLVPENPKSAIMVMDVGGWTTQIAIVNNDKVVDSITFPWGGEVMIEQIVGMLQEESSQKTGNPPLQDARSLSLLQIQARQAMAELSTKSRANVHVPYLFADPRNHHLDTSIARTVLETVVENHLRQEIIAHLDESFFSPHMPKPTDFASLFTSLITQLLEQSRILPHHVDSVLLVGGAAKVPLVQRHLASALHLLMGPSGADKLLRPDESTALTVLGAATLPPSFDYDLHLGLVRR